jgi:hypothetical protein
MKAHRVWTAALGLSVVIHLAAAALLPAMITPDTVAPQPRPQSTLQIETLQVDRSEAAATDPVGEAAREQQAMATQLSQGAITQGRAAARRPAQDVAEARQPVSVSATHTPPAMNVLAATPAEPLLVAAAAQSPSAIAAAVSPPTTAAPAVPAPKAQLVASAAQTVVAASIAPSQEAAARPADMTDPLAQPIVILAPELALAKAKAPSIEATLSATDPAQVVLSDRAEMIARPAAPAPAPPATALFDRTAAHMAPLSASTPIAERFTADLAWSSTAEAQIDAQSLATIQSFMRPGDLARQTAEVRDALTALLAAVPCARLQAVFDPDSGAIDLRGHIPEDAMRGPVLVALQQQAGAGLLVRDEMLILPRPQCGALSGIASVGLPQSTDQLTNPLLVGEDAHARAFDYVRGDRLVFDLTAPDYDAFVYVDYFDADGQVIHLLPNAMVPLRVQRAKSAMRIGAGDDDGLPFLDITIGPPYGQEIAVAFAASAPLYDGVRPTIEPAEGYLVWLTAKVAEARAADPGFKGEWVYFFVTTRPD